MKAILSAVLASALVLGFASTGEAAQKKRYSKRPHAVSSGQSTKYPNATARQRANSEAFDKGQYYEYISDQHAFGSRSWWLLKERELGGGSFN